MKREDLKALELSDEVIEKIMSLHGRGIETHKSAAQTALAEVETIKTQLAEANKQIESFKTLDIQGVKKAADDYKAKWEQAQTDAAAQLAQIKFDHALEAALTNAKAKNLKAVTALLSKDSIKVKDDGTIEGLSEQLEKIRSENDYLFENAQPPAPKVVTKTNNQNILDDPQLAAMRRGAGLSTPQGK